MDVFTMAMKDKESLDHELRELTAKEIRSLIKVKHLDVYKPILKEKNKEVLIDYVINEATRQMMSATVI